MSLKNFNIDKSWTLFLDRDGVINKRLVDDYVKSISEFEFLPGALKALVNLSSFFDKVFIISNQQGVAKGLMRTEDVELLHEFLMDEVRSKGGRIDCAYYAPELDSGMKILRKPGIGMIIKALYEFPGIKLTKSIMVGDSESDILLGKKLNMKTIFIKGKYKTGHKFHADISFQSLLDFSNSLSCLQH